jgi:hypothetical protein
VAAGSAYVRNTGQTVDFSREKPEKNVPTGVRCRTQRRSRGIRFDPEHNYGCRENHASMRESRITKSRPSSGGVGWKSTKTGEV